MSVRLLEFKILKGRKNGLLTRVVNVLNNSYVMDTTALSLLAVAQKYATTDFVVSCRGDYKVVFDSRNESNLSRINDDAEEWYSIIKDEFNYVQEHLDEIKAFLSEYNSQSYNGRFYELLDKHPAVKRVGRYTYTHEQYDNIVATTTLYTVFDGVRDHELFVVTLYDEY